MSTVLLTVLGVGTGVVVIVVAVAVVLVVLLVTLSIRGRERRGATRRDDARQELREARERAANAERDRNVAQEQTERRNDLDL